MKRIVCLLLIIVLLAGVAAPARALDIWFIAVDDSIPFTFTGSGVPFYYDSQLYVPSDAFASDASKSLSVFSIYDSSQYVLALYNINHRLTFDLASGTVTNLAGDTDDVAALSRGGTIFVPVNYVAGYFGLGCSLLEGSGGYPIVRLTSGSERLEDDLFVTQSQTLVQLRVSQYTASLEQEPEPSVSVAPSPAVTPSVKPSTEPTIKPTDEPDDRPTEPAESTAEPAISPETVLFLPGEYYSDVSNVLSGTPAVFTYAPETLEGSDDGVRAIICGGYPIALALDLSSADAALSELKTCNDQLDAMCKSKSMLVIPADAQNVTPEAVSALEAQGCRVWSNTVTVTDDFNISDYSGSVAIYSPAVNAFRLSMFIKYVQATSGSFKKIGLTTNPYAEPVLSGEAPA